MTYKAIRAKLVSLEETGRLVRYQPSYFDPDESEKRELLMLSGLHSWLYQSDRKKSVDYKTKIHAHLNLFVKGKDIDNRDFIKCLSYDVFEFRIWFLKKKEYTRIFGAFVIPDVFVATHWKMRHDLGPRGDPRWDATINRTIKDLNGILPGVKPIACRPFSNCVTFAAYDHGIGS